MRHIKAEIIETARLVPEPLRFEHAEPMAIVVADSQLHAFIGVSLLRLDGHSSIAAANRHHARDPRRTLTLLQTA
jgi:hypothetical protein